MIRKMGSEMSIAIKQLIQDKGISEELILKSIEDLLIAAYKKKYGTADNAVVRFNEEKTEVTIFAQKRIVENITDPILEISLQDALTYNSECEIGDELLIEINRALFSIEDQLKPVSLMLWYHLIELIGEISNKAENVGDRLMLFLSK